MSVLGLFIQDQRTKSNLFLHTKNELANQQAKLLTVQFAKEISSITEIRGQTILFDRYRAFYILLNEVYIVTLGYLKDYPFSTIKCCELIKNSLYSICKGYDLGPSILLKKYQQVFLCLDELLNRSFYQINEKYEDKEEVEKKTKLVHEDRFEILSNFNFKTNNSIQKQHQEILQSTVLDSFVAPEENIKPILRSSSFGDIDPSGMSVERMKELEQIESGLTKADLSSLSKQETMYRKFEPRIREKEETKVKRLDSWKPLKLDDTPMPNSKDTNLEKKKEVIDSIFEPKKNTKLPPPPKIAEPHVPPPSREAPVLPTTSTTPKSTAKTPTNLPPKPVVKKTDTSPTPVKKPKTPTTPTKNSLVEDRVSTPQPPKKSDATMKKVDSLRGLKDKSPTSQPILQPTIQPKPMQQPILQPTIQPKPVSIGEHIKQQNDTSIIYLPLKIIQTESINTIFKENDILNYKLNGQLSVKFFDHSRYQRGEKIRFILHLKNQKKLSTIVNNKNFSRKDEKNENKFKFEIPMEKFGEKLDQEVVLLKYNLVPDFKPIPIKIILNKLVKENQIQIQIKYKINPVSNLSKLSFLLSPLFQNQNVKIIKQESKPEGKWNSVQEKLLWRMTDPELQGTLISMYKTDNIPVNTKTPPLLLQFFSSGVSFSDLVIDGCDSKRSENFEVFVGGIEKTVTSGKYEFQFN